ncbi:hypothetical protein [Aurantiacibacter luteus]|uniref:hypothetical protein n=1 Tax=Aurantiacibacter luteus TaxID=1581420 RepID=UPI0012E02683|nr:hypothetical protein [Aurantiacibacter luteus]
MSTSDEPFGFCLADGFELKEAWRKIAIDMAVEANGDLAIFERRRAYLLRDKRLLAITDKQNQSLKTFFWDVRTIVRAWKSIPAIPRDQFLRGDTAYSGLSSKVRREGWRSE